MAFVHEVSTTERQLQQMRGDDRGVVHRKVRRCPDVDQQILEQRVSESKLMGAYCQEHDYCHDRERWEQYAADEDRERNASASETPEHYRQLKQRACRTACSAPLTSSP